MSNYQNNNPYSSHDSTSQQNQQQYGGYTAPPGPPPGQAPKRADTFKESDFVPDSQRGEQREAMQQFEMSKAQSGEAGGESQQDRDVAELQRQFPSVDGSLIAALYGDSGNMGATREMLMELVSSEGSGGQGQGS